MDDLGNDILNVISTKVLDDLQVILQDGRVYGDGWLGVTHFKEGHVRISTY
jgi:hypothetical protein